MTEFISRNYGNEGYEIIIKTDSHEHYRATEEFARRLIDHAKPMRNADKIRSMSDEDLAELISRSSIHDLCDIVCGGDCNAVATFNKTSEQRCTEIILDWLQQPAEEGER